MRYDKSMWKPNFTPMTYRICSSFISFQILQQVSVFWFLQNFRDRLQEFISINVCVGWWHWADGPSCVSVLLRFLYSAGTGPGRLSLPLLWNVEGAQCARVHWQKSTTLGNIISFCCLWGWNSWNLSERFTLEKQHKEEKKKNKI